MHLGGISGIETRRRLAELDLSIPVIFITGDDTAASRKEARDAGCIAYLVKLVSGYTLIHEISKAASVHQAH